MITSVIRAELVKRHLVCGFDGNDTSSREKRKRRCVPRLHAHTDTIAVTCVERDCMTYRMIRPPSPPCAPVRATPAAAAAAAAAAEGDVS